MGRAKLVVLLAFAIGLTPAARLAAEDEQGHDPAKAAFFESKVRPLLVEHCFDCHQAGNAESKLSLDSLGGMLRGGLRGPAVIPGKAEESLMIRALRHGELLKMPPKRKLPAVEVAVFAKWIADGAVWPNAKPVEPIRSNKNVIEFNEEQKSFWSLQQPVDWPLRKVSRPDWCQSPIDHFVLAKLDAAKLSPSATATKRKLIRRAAFSLTGLPPTPTQVRAFLADTSPDAFARLVDRLLASPHYGQRWGRHWLDVVRYADSNGMDENLAYANAYRYRDYVIDAFNHNKPFDRFVQEQLAGDLLENDGSAGNEFDRIVATGFLSLGPKMLAEDDPVKMHMDIIDEQLDTIGRAFMGLTLGCARCHDHKFDPVPTQDYYSLAGIFKSTKTMDTYTVVAKWHERSLATPDAIAARDAQQKKIDAATEKIDDLQRIAIKSVVTEARKHVGDYLLAAEASRRRDELLAKLKPVGDDAAVRKRDDVLFREAENFDRGNVNKDFATYGKGIGVLVNQGQLPNFTEYDISGLQAGKYRLEVRYAAAAARPTKLMLNGELLQSDIADGVTGSWTPESQRWEVEGIVTLAEGKHVLRLEHAQFFPHIDKLLLVPATETESVKVPPLDADYRLIAPFVTQWKSVLAKAAKLDANSTSELSVLKPFLSVFDSGDHKRIREVAAELQQQTVDAMSLEFESKPTPFAHFVVKVDGAFKAQDGLGPHFAETERKQLADLRKTKDALTKSMPEFPSTMAVEDGKIEDVRVHFRGSHLTQGEVAPRRFLQIIAGTDQPAISSDRSGRRELAEWLTSNKHPLTARVFVNRVWQWHFGHGLVRSPDNFGRLGDRPTHPQLLDWLTVRFIESDWDVKQLHRMILLSSTWQMSTQFNDAAMAVDPENRLLWRMNRRRLEAEAVRDSLFAVSGELDEKMRGTMLPTANRKYVTSTANVDPVVYVTNRRSVYMPVVRSALYDVFQAFDFADPSAQNGRRQSTTVASQALFMMNSEISAKLTKRLARKLLADQKWNDPMRIQELFETCYSRAATDSEVTRLVEFIGRYESKWSMLRPDAAKEANLRAWQAACRIVVSANEFIYVD